MVLRQVRMRCMCDRHWDSLELCLMPPMLPRMYVKTCARNATDGKRRLRTGRVASALLGGGQSRRRSARQGRLDVHRLQD